MRLKNKFLLCTQYIKKNKRLIDVYMLFNFLIPAKVSNEIERQSSACKSIDSTPPIEAP